MKLELKHLAPYLPYGLKIFIPDGNGIGTLDCLSTDGIISQFAFGIKERIGLHNPVQWQIKPLLIPLTPIQNFVVLTTDECALVANGLVHNIPQWEYEILVEHHFDVFGLIPAGLALNKLDHI